MMTTPFFLLLLIAKAPEKSVYLPPNLYLVRARTVAVGTREVAGPPPRLRIPEARFEIVRVYLGPGWLSNRTFTCDQVPYQVTVTSPLARLHVQVGLEKGAEGIWWVKYDPLGRGELRPVREAGVVDDAGIRPFPYQRIKAEGNRYHMTAASMEGSFREGLAWAEAVEKVYRSPSDVERGRLLRGLGAEHSARSTWAIACLAHSGDKNLVPLFRKWIGEEKRPIAGSVILDQALSLLAGKAWEGTDDQRALHRRWRETHPGPVLPISLQVLQGRRLERGMPPILPFQHRFPGSFNP